MSEVRRVVTYPHPPAIVWHALTTRERIAEWLMPNDFSPAVGTRFDLRARPMPGWDGVIHCEVLELDAPRRMVWSWRGSNMKAPTRVTFTLDAVGGATRLTLEHAGFRGLGGFLLGRMHGAGWGGKFLGRQLRELLDRLAAGAGRPT